MVEFDAYAADCRVFGQFELVEGRLSDQLNRTPELLVRNARLEDLIDGHVVAMPELTVASDELCAVVASGPRGDTGRRLHTVRARVEAEVGPYLVVGWVHGTAAAEPLGSALRRGTWVALTEATVIYRLGADDVRERAETLLVNRHLMRSFRALEEVRVSLPWEAPRVPDAAPPSAIASTGAPPEGAPPKSDETDRPVPPKPNP